MWSTPTHMTINTVYILRINAGDTECVKCDKFLANFTSVLKCHVASVFVAHLWKSFTVYTIISNTVIL